MFDIKTIGDDGLDLCAVGMGCSAIGNLYEAITEDRARDVLQYAWNEGIRYFDTAPHYGRGLSEQRLGAFLTHQDRKAFRVSTKVGRVLRPGPELDAADGFVKPLSNAVHYDYSAEGIAESLAGSRQRLGVDYIDLVYVHDIGERTHGTANARHLEVLLESGLPYLESLRQAGEIGGYGLGVNENEICVEVLRKHRLDAILLAGRWTLLDRSAERELVPLCKQHNTSLILGGVFNSGILATGPTPNAHFDYAPPSPEIVARVTALQQACEQNGVPLATAALHFAMTRPMVASILVGTARMSSLKRNLEAIRTEISADLVAGLASKAL